MMYGFTGAIIQTVGAENDKLREQLATARQEAGEWMVRAHQASTAADHQAEDFERERAAARAERDRLAKSTRALLDSLEGLYREGMIDESPEDAAISAREFVERDATCLEARRALATGGQPPEETK